MDSGTGAGRRSGYFQGAIMLAGFFLTMTFMCSYFAGLISFMLHSNGRQPLSMKELCRPYAWAGIWGISLCVVAWCWALFSSIGILRAAAESPAAPPLLPT